MTREEWIAALTDEVDERLELLAGCTFGGSSLRKKDDGSTDLVLYLHPNNDEAV